jgi:potassium/hydrogen antiporter
LEPTGSQSGPRPPAIPLPRDLIRMLEAARSRLYFRLWQRRQRRQVRRAERSSARQARKRAKAEATPPND